MRNPVRALTSLFRRKPLRQIDLLRGLAADLPDSFDGALAAVAPPAAKHTYRFDVAVFDSSDGSSAMVGLSDQDGDRAVYYRDAMAIMASLAQTVFAAPEPACCALCCERHRAMRAFARAARVAR